MSPLPGQSWRRDPHARQRVTDGLRTFAWVTVITLLIWVYADVQFTDTLEFTAELVVTSASSPNLVVTDPTEPVTVQFAVRGNHYLIQKFADQLQQNGLLKYDAAAQLKEPRKYSEQLADVLGSLPEIKANGLDVVRANDKQGGRSLDIVLDEAQTLRGVPVKLQYNGGEIDPAATVMEPDRIDLRVPVSRLKGIDPAKLELGTQSVDLSQLPAGETFTRQLSIQQPAAVVSGLKLPLVKATFKVVQKTAPRQFQDVPVKVLLPKTWEEDDTWTTYKLESPGGETWLRTITVTGNQIDLDKLRKEDIQAYIVLTDADKAGSLGLGKVTVHLPPELKVQLTSDTIKEVQYTLVKRADAKPGR